MNESEIWVCQACGREDVSRAALQARASSCGTWGVRVDPATIERDADGKIVRAAALVGAVDGP